MIKPHINVSRHLASRRAMKAWRERQRLVMVFKRFHDGQVTTRLLIDGEYYDVDDAQLAMLAEGAAPAELDLHPAFEPEE
ncbi:hypothetical protein EET67_07570 [Pseudaminobacter arsenicus]|uniref:Uncharacterized protein n=1 Tax=Borborobacter arsenicus TaxID=1851146 RepID=A0A432V8K9_9HYPH|nr:hypothetical protein [Pseudaminobacter arsenicus]RUM98480.1 hypothetical protein EET67_07570 [Pseudaminobacter arsenicus]